MFDFMARYACFQPQSSADIFLLIFLLLALEYMYN